MKRFVPLARVLIICIGCTVGCNDNPFDLDELLPPALYVTVVDENDNPIPDVGFHYIFYCNEDVIVRNPIMSFGLETPDSVTLKIYDPFGNHLKTIWEKNFVQAGQFAIFYDGTNTTNGVYEYEFTASSTSKRIKFFIRTDNTLELASMSPLIVSSHEGAFAVSYDALGIGQSITRQPLNTEFIIANSITVVLVKEGYQTFTETITVDKNKASRHTFRMEAN